MSMGSIKPITTAEDLAALPKDELRLQARAALAAGYKVDVRHIRYEYMVFANGKHFHPLTNWQQCVRLVVDTGSSISIGDGYVAVFTPYTKDGEVEGEVYEGRNPTSDQEYYNQMCDAVVTNVAKGCEF